MARQPIPMTRLLVLVAAIWKRFFYPQRRGVLSMMSWEMKAANRVLVGILHTEIVPLAWAFGLKNLQIPGQISPVAGRPFDDGRNQLCRTCLDGGFEYVFFYDSDVIAPGNTIYRLMAHNLPVVSGVYHRRSPPAGIPVMLRKNPRSGNTEWIMHYPTNRLIEVDLVGAGCMLVHRSVLETLPPIDPVRGKHWFDWRVDMPNLPKGDALSEDFSFCKQVREKLGIKIMVDTGIICRHAGLSQYLHGKAEPLECVPA